MIFDLRDFEDLSKASDDKLRKLMDVARDYERECHKEWTAAKERRMLIEKEQKRRALAKSFSRIKGA